MVARTDSDPAPHDYELANQIVRAIIRQTQGDEAAESFDGVEKYGPGQTTIGRRLSEAENFDMDEPDLEDCE